MFIFIFVKIKMNAESIYNKVKSIEENAEKRAYLKSLTAEEKVAYDKYRNKINAKKFNDRPENKTRYNEIRKKHIKDERKLHPEHFQEQNLKDLKTFREKQKKKMALLVITNAIRTKKARAEMTRLKNIKDEMSRLEGLLSNLRLEIKK